MSEHVYLLFNNTMISNAIHETLLYTHCQEAREPCDMVERSIDDMELLDISRSFSFLLALLI